MSGRVVTRWNASARLWENWREGGKRVSRRFGSRDEAVAAGRRTALREGVEHVVEGEGTERGRAETAERG